VRELEEEKERKASFRQEMQRVNLLKFITSEPLPNRNQLLSLILKNGSP
jgi:hypothetical protein